MKQDINLLPREDQQKRRCRMYLIGLGRLLNRIYVPLMLVIVAQVIIFNVYSSTLAETKFSEGSREQGEGDAQQQAELLNELLVSFHNETKKQILWTPLIGDILAVVPKLILVTDMVVGEDTDVITIRGKSLARASVLELQKSLESLFWVDKVEAPLQNYTVGEEAEFMLSIYRRQ